MNVQEIVFIGVMAITILGAVMAVWIKNVFYNAVSLILCLFGVACLFIYLNSEFLAIIEVIIYIGAISIAIIFAIMLSQPHLIQNEPRNRNKMLRALVIGVLLFLGLQKTLRSAHWPLVSAEGDYSMRAIGHDFLTHSLLPFEAVSLVLLIAIIGALLISNREKT
jgi:NADH:ubiquinone oxidoreductase subunit 6 (subunit J)